MKSVELPHGITDQRNSEQEGQSEHRPDSERGEAVCRETAQWPGQGSRPRDWVRGQGLGIGPIHLISQWRESRVGIMDSEVNVLLTFCVRILCPQPRMSAV